MADITVDISQLGEAIEDDIEAKVRKVIIGIFVALDSASPLGRPELWQAKPPKGYKAGWFKANWRIVIGSAAPTEPVNVNTRLSLKPNANKFKLGKPAFILNNAPYAEVLAQGHSQQAPVGWVDNAARAGVKIGSR